MSVSNMIHRLSEGDLNAIDQIYLTYHKRLKGYGVQLVGYDHQEEVQEVLQEFFLWLAQNYNKVADIKDFEVYLFQSIRRNLGIRMKRKAKAQSVHDRFIRRTSSLRETEELSPEDSFIQGETNERLFNMVNIEINKLPSYQREVLYLRFFEELSYKEIARILSITDQVARNYIYRAIKNLKKQFKDVESLLLVISLFILQSV